MQAQGLGRCIAIFTWGFHAHLITTHSLLQSYLPPSTSSHIYIWKRRGTLSLQYLAQAQYNAPTLETKTGLLNVESSAPRVSG